jgi:UDP-N-acetylmuramoyl-L-alanyl-D-glutamate--2,6-diaminopimelate ligase
MKLHILLKSLQLLEPVSVPDIEITSLENDNRKVQKGCLFICVKGNTVDGHDFAADAVKKGAAAILSEKKLSVPVPVIVVKNTVRAMAVLADTFYNQPSHKLHLIGVTGTNGKTTTSHIIEKIFADFGKKTGIIGTMYTKIGEKTYETKNTTPETLTLQKIFKKMVDEEVETAVMEVSSHALDVGRAHGCDFNTAVFTNLSQDHLDYHLTMDEYRRTKSLLFAQLGNTFNKLSPKFAVINIDDMAANLFMKSTAAHIITYGINGNADIKAVNIDMSANGTTFDLITPVGNEKVTIHLIGRFSIYNILAGIGAALVYGIPLPEIVRSVAEIKGISGRFELVNAGQNFPVIVDYAHTPDSLENVLKTIRQFAQKRIFVVVGCGGDRDKTKRPLMAKIACTYGTNPVFTSDNPRSEDPRQIIRDMESGVIGAKYEVFVNRKDAIRFCINEAQQDDVILIAGKGHETYQQVGDQTIPFDDRIVAKEAIRERFGCF